MWKANRSREITVRTNDNLQKAREITRVQHTRAGCFSVLKKSGAKL